MILGASLLQLPAIQIALEMGLHVIVVDMNPNAIGFLEDGVIKEVISTIDIIKVVEAAKRHQVDGIMTLASDMPMRAVAAVAKDLHLVGIDDATALRTTNKAEMRKALAAQGVPIPKFFIVSSREEYERATQQFTVPFIVKPVDNSGSRGVVKIANLTDRQSIFDAYNYSKASSRNGNIIIEEYMCGPEVSVETLSIDGTCYVIQITDKVTTGAPHFIEMGHSQPTKHSNETIKRIREVAIAANKAVGITIGPSHTELIVTTEGPKVVELGARLGGDCITTHLVPLSTGVNMVECCIRIALGEKPNINSKFNRGAAIRYFHQHAGIVNNIKGIERAKQVEGVKQITFAYRVGEEVTEIIDSSSRIGFVISQADSADNAIKICEEALREIEIDIK